LGKGGNYSKEETIERQETIQENTVVEATFFKS